MGIPAESKHRVSATNPGPHAHIVRERCSASSRYVDIVVVNSNDVEAKLCIKVPQQPSLATRQPRS